MLAVKHVSRNIFPYKSTSSGWITGRILEDGSIVTSQANYRYREIPLSVCPPGQYTFQFRKTAYVGSPSNNLWVFYDASENIIGLAGSDNSFTPAHNSYTVTVPVNTSKIMYSRRYTDVDLMLEVGTVEHAYEEYGVSNLEPVATAMSLPAQLQPGETIIMNLDGVNRRYRVLRQSDNNDNVYTILTQFDIGSSGRFNSSTAQGNNYVGSALQTAMENWYGNLPAASQAAIVAVSLNSYRYMWGNSYEYSSKTLAGTATDQHVYPLDLEDIEMYFGGTGGSVSDKTPGTFTGAQLRELFGIGYNDTETIWLRSGDVGVSYYSLTVNHDYAGDSASISAAQVDRSKYIRGMMVIDLTDLIYTREATPNSLGAYMLVGGGVRTATRSIL